MNRQSFEELPPRTPADGCESMDDTEYFEYSNEHSFLFTKIKQFSCHTKLSAENMFRRKFLNANMEILRMKRASLKRKDSFLFQRHRQIKKRLHDFLNSAFCEEKTGDVPAADQRMSTPTKNRVIEMVSPSSPGLLTILKRGKKCTFC